MGNLRSSLIRLAQARPELRSSLLPLLKEASAFPRVVREVEDAYRRKAITTGEKNELLAGIENAETEREAQKIVDDHRKGRSAKMAAATPSAWMRGKGLQGQIGAFRLFIVNDAKQYALYLAPNTLENSMRLDRAGKVLRWPSDEEVASSLGESQRKPGSVPFSPAMLQTASRYQLSVLIYADGLVSYRLRPENAVGSDLALMSRRFDDPLDARSSLAKINPRRFLKHFDGKKASFHPFGK